jgi:hypothetical protein
MERAIAKPGLSVFRRRLVSGPGQGLSKSCLPDADSDPVSDGSERLVVDVPFGHRLEQDAGGKLVSPGRECHVVCVLRTPVELGGSPRSRAGAAGEAAVFDVEQSVIGETVEVVGGHLTGHLDRVGGGVPANWHGGSGDELV